MRHMVLKLTMRFLLFYCFRGRVRGRRRGNTKQQTPSRPVIPKVASGDHTPQPQPQRSVINTILKLWCLERSHRVHLCIFSIFCLVFTKYPFTFPLRFTVPGAAEDHRPWEKLPLTAQTSPLISTIWCLRFNNWISNTANRKLYWDVKWNNELE